MPTLAASAVMLAALFAPEGPVAEPDEALSPPALTIYEAPGEPVAAGPIDEMVLARLAEKGVRPARLCADAVFLRRAYLDVVGALPTAKEARAFLADRHPQKRLALVDRLLEDERFADYQAMRWGDVLRIKAEFPINLWPNAVQAYDRWLRTALAEGMPYDAMARALLTSSGSNFRVPPVNFYRAVQGKEPPALARASALTFMGDRMGYWPEDRQTGLAALFSRVGYKSTTEWKEEIVFFDLASKPVTSAVLPDGSRVALAPDEDPRKVFADWLITPENPWFGRCVVNRVWTWLMGRGLVHEPDDIRPDNPPSHPDVLERLARELAAADWDLKHTYRTILASTAYQLASVPRSDHPEAARLGASYPVRRLEAEVLIDALCALTGTAEEYSSMIPEPFTWVPGRVGAVRLPDGSITSPFLELFGRPPRDTGMAAERTLTATAAQRLHLLNSSHVREKLEKSPALRALARQAQRVPASAATELYLAVLSRYPTEDELAALKAYVDETRSERGPGPLVDMLWALVNSPEFLYRH